MLLLETATERSAATGGRPPVGGHRWAVQRATVGNGYGAQLAATPGWGHPWVGRRSPHHGDDGLGLDQDLLLVLLFGGGCAGVKLTAAAGVLRRELQL